MDIHIDRDAIAIIISAIALAISIGTLAFNWLFDNWR